MSQLKGKTLFISREKFKAEDFIRPLEKLGANVIAHSLIAFELKEDSKQDAINRFSQFDWIVFTSANGVKYFFETLNRENIPISKIKHIKKAVVGSKTKEALEQFGVKSHFMPEIYDAEHFSQSFINDMKPNHVLLIKGNLSRDVIDNKLDEVNIPYDTWTVYKTVVNNKVKTIINRELTEGVDALVFTSPSSINAFLKLVEFKNSFFSKPCFCIGETTREKAVQSGFINTIVPEVYTLEGLSDAVVHYYSIKGE